MRGSSEAGRAPRERVSGRGDQSVGRKMSQRVAGLAEHGGGALRGGFIVTAVRPPPALADHLRRSGALCRAAYRPSSP